MILFTYGNYKSWNDFMLKGVIGNETETCDYRLWLDGVVARRERNGKDPAD